MSTNFFQWIRDGVKQSVLQGVSDAIETLGAPAESKSIHPSVQGLLGSRDGQAPKLERDSKSSGESGRKRLGKSLRDINPSS